MAARKTPQRGPEDQTILLAFRIERGKLHLINRHGKNVPLCSARRLISRVGLDPSDSLRGVITRAVKRKKR